MYAILQWLFYFALAGTLVNHVMFIRIYLEVINTIDLFGRFPESKVKCDDYVLSVRKNITILSWRWLAVSNLLGITAMSLFLSLTIPIHPWLLWLVIGLSVIVAILHEWCYRTLHHYKLNTLDLHA